MLLLPATELRAADRAGVGGLGQEVRKSLEKREPSLPLTGRAMYGNKTSPNCSHPQQVLVLRCGHLSWAWLVFFHLPCVFCGNIKMAALPRGLRPPLEDRLSVGVQEIVGKCLVVEWITECPQKPGVCKREQLRHPL